MNSEIRAPVENAILVTGEIFLIGFEGGTCADGRGGILRFFRKIRAKLSQ
jgi:hypothetical protein